MTPKDSKHEEKKRAFRFSVDPAGVVHDHTDKHADSQPFRDIFGDLFGTDASFNKSAFPESRNSAASVVQTSPEKIHVPNVAILLPIFGIVWFAIYYYGYVQTPAASHKTVYALTSLSSRYFETYYWQRHGLLMGFVFLIGTAILPRITMSWFAVLNPFGSVASWGWLVAPRTYLAAITTAMYWRTNPEICVVTWIIAYSIAGFKVDWLREELGKAGDEGLEILIKGLGIILAVIAALGVGYLLLWLLAKALQALVVSISNTNAIIACIVGVFMFGCALYIFRHVSRLWYGVTEIVFALLLAGVTIARSANSGGKLADLNLFTTLLALSSSIYIVVRGLDNIGWDSLRATFVKLGEVAISKNPLRRRRPEVAATATKAAPSG